MWPFSDEDRELKPEQDAKKLAALNALAKRFAKHVKPKTEAQLLITRDKNNPKLLTQWTVASDPIKGYTDTDELELIGAGADTLNKIKENALLIALNKSNGGTAYARSG